MDFLSFYWRDVLDIALVTLLLYRILLLIRGTRAFSALIGLVVLVAVYALSHFIGLYSLSWLLENLFGSLFLVIVILFHDDIRQALAAMGTQYLSWKKRPAPSNMVGDLVWVCQYFAKRRIGALIVLEGKVQLGDMMKGGVVLDARISRELLLTIFFPNTALHDGAVIIRKGRSGVYPAAGADGPPEFRYAAPRRAWRYGSQRCDGHCRFRGTRRSERGL